MEQILNTTARGLILILYFWAMLTLEGLQFAYGNQPVLRHLDLQVPDGEIHGILGANGAGKTTLFRLLAGWLAPDAGDIRWNGQPLTKRQIAFLETDPYFYPYLKGVEYLRLIRDDQMAIEQWNQLFGLPLHHLVDEYSTGMQKKLAFIGTLLQQRPVLILDEPFNGVDLAGNEMMMAVLRRQEIRSGAMVIASHILSTLTQTCQRISILSGGQIRQTFTREAFDDLEKQVQADASNQLDHILSTWK